MSDGVTDSPCHSRRSRSRAANPPRRRLAEPAGQPTLGLMHTSCMDDVIAVRVRLDTGALRYFVTWGRIFDAVDPSRTEALVLDFAGRCSLGGKALSAETCWSLRDARDETYFYEALVSYSGQLAGRPTDDAGHDRWVADRAAAMAQGREIYYLGLPRP